MSTDAVIEAAARCIYNADGWREWDEADDWRGPSEHGGGVKNSYLRNARALYDAGLLADKLPAEPPPVGQVRRSLNGKTVAVRFDEVTNPWNCSDGVCRNDNDVRDWLILVPETDLDDLRAERDRIYGDLIRVREKCAHEVAEARHQKRRADRLEARVAELEAAEECAVDADALAIALWNKSILRGVGLDELRAAIREHLPTATRPALPEGLITLDMSSWGEDSLHDLSESRPDSWTSMAGVNIAATAARAELARRAAELPERITP